MGKSFLNLKTDPGKKSFLLAGVGIFLSVVMGINAYRDSLIPDEHLQRNQVGEGDYEQSLIAWIDGKEKIPVKVIVEERKLTEEEAEKLFSDAIPLLEETLRGNNESLKRVTEDLQLADYVPGLPVEVQWTSIPSEYFLPDGTLRKDQEMEEPVELELCAILSCQEYMKDFKTEITLMPGERTKESILLRMIEEGEKPGEAVLTLPGDYEGRKVTWKKPVEHTFLYVLALSAGSVIFLNFGRKRDLLLERKERMEEMEKDYAQVVSKFTMLLSAGLSVRNAWERIVLLYRKNSGQRKVIYEEMGLALREIEKGVSEIEVYEAFGARIGQVHYKKLMALFVSDQRRGGISLPETMNQEMLQAWEEQKRKTRQQGEKIGVKLLFPMMGMLAVVFLMILVPAFLSFQL